MRCCLVIIFLFTSAFVLAQNEITNLGFFTNKDGLTNNNVHCITKDSRGFLWIGTIEGLNRFDGLHFKQYFAAKDISESLAANSIFTIIEYRYGQLLIGTSNGISVLNTITGKFENDKLRFAPLRIGSGTQINSFFKDKQGRIWINSNGEVDILDSTLNYIQRFTDVPWARGLKGVKVVFEDWQIDKQGRLWLPSDISGINIIDFAAKQIWNYKNNPKDLPYLKFNYIRSMLLDEDSNVLWYAAWGSGLYKYDLLTNKLQQQLFSIKQAGEKRSINCIIKTNSGDLLCAAGKSLYQVNTATLQYSKKENAAPLKENLSPVNLYYDEQNKFHWLGTVNGLLQFTDRSVGTNLIINKNPNQPVNFNNVIQANGNLYTIYNGHLVEVDKGRTNFHIYSLPNKNAVTRGLCADKKGTIWIGTNDGVFLFNTQTKKVSRFLLLPETAKPNLYNTIFSDSDGDVWLTTRDTLNIYRVNVQQMHVDKIDNDVITAFKANRSKNIITQITEDAQHNLWMISELGNGILRYNKPSGKWKLFPGKDSKNDLILKKGFFLINAIGNSLWLNNYYMGLLKYNPSKDETRIFTRNDGLLSDYIWSVNYDGKENLWIITEKGITQFNIHTQKTKSKNIPNIEFPSGYISSTYDSLSNSIVYGAKDILSFIRLQEIPFDKPPPVPEINLISVNNKPQFIDPGKKFSLEYDQNTISLDFTAVQFTDADKIKFAYQLTGVDKEWQYADVNRVVQYANLAPGNYTFKIKTGNESGTWSKDYSPVSFAIIPPFWMTWWFIAIAIAAVACFIYILIIRRIRQIKKEADLKHEINEAFLKGQIIERKRVSADLHDEIGSALSTIGIFSDLAKRKAQKTAPELVGELERIGLKSREMVQTMRDTIWTISDNHSQNIWERMQQYGTETLTARDILFSWQTSLNEKDIHLSFLEKKNLFMAYKEAINNIIKHSEATAVSINIFKHDQLVVEITDNGKGFELVATEKGNGIKNFVNRMRDIGGIANIESTPGKGTKLIFCIKTNT